MGLTVDDLADRLGKNRATVYRYESDEIENFPITIIYHLADILQTSPQFLMGWDKNEIPWDKEFRDRVMDCIQSADSADAEASGIDYEAIRSLVEETRWITLERACDIADQLGVSIDFLVGREEIDDNTEKPVAISSDGLSEKKRMLLEIINGMDETQIGMYLEIARAIRAEHKK